MPWHFLCATVSVVSLVKDDLCTSHIRWEHRSMNDIENHGDNNSDDDDDDADE